jgi:hypothetical protein
MDTLEKTHRRHDRTMTLLMALLAAGFFMAIGFWPVDRPAPTDLPTAGYRRAQDELKRSLLEWSELVDALPGASPERQREIMDFAVAFLALHVLPRARVEERLLFPAVGRYADPSLMATLREEHRILERWVHELEARGHEAIPDPSAFRSRAHGIAGLLLAHLEVEERVLLPVLDRRMSPDQFRREVWSLMIPDIE